MTSKRITVMRQLLAFSGIEQERLRLEWVSSAEGPRFAEVITDFTNQIKALGPSRLKVAA
jgi:F420-non-reducing hydrogenase iron-sulfur subunit